MFVWKYVSMEDNKLLILKKEIKDFLYNFLNKLGHRDCKVYFTLASNPRDSYLGVVAKAKIQCNGVKFNWIIKSVTQNENYRLLLPISSIYNREIYVYEKVLVEFAQLQEERNIEDSFKSYAPYLTSSFLPPNECIIMEDMTQWGYKIQNRDLPLDYNHVKLVMREYGRFHALSFALRVHKPELFNEIAENTKELFLNYPALLKGAAEQIVDLQIDRIINALDLEDKSAYQKCLNFKKRAMASLRSSVQAFMAGDYSVVCHGECWTNNILFQYSDPNHADVPTKLCFIDWLLCRSGSPVLDISTFIFTCTDQQFRNEYYEEMLNVYHQSLSSFLIKLGCDPEELFPYDVLQAHLKRFSVYGFYIAIQLHYLAITENEECPDLDAIVNGNFEIAEYSKEKLDKFNTKVREIVLDFDRLGYNL